MFLNGEEIATPDAHGNKVVDDSFLLLFNATHEDVTFTLPNRRFGKRWTVDLDTAEPDPHDVECTVAARSELPVTASSTELLRRCE
jgi:glycogen operon protein